MTSLIAGIVVAALVALAALLGVPPAFCVPFGLLAGWLIYSPIRAWLWMENEKWVDQGPRQR